METKKSDASKEKSNASNSTSHQGLRRQKSGGRSESAYRSGRNLRLHRPQRRGQDYHAEIRGGHSGTSTKGRFSSAVCPFRPTRWRCKRQMAYIPDNPDLYEFMTGIQYLNFIADVFGGRRRHVRQERIRKYADAFRADRRSGAAHRGLFPRHEAEAGHHLRMDSRAQAAS